MAWLKLVSLLVLASAEDCANLLQRDTVLSRDKEDTASGFQIQVMAFSGTSKVVDVGSNTRGDQLKAKIQAKFGVPTDQQRLIYGGKQLEDGETMVERHIEEGATIHLAISR